MKLFRFSMAVLVLSVGPVVLQAQNAEDYRLGPGDQISVHVRNLEEIPDKPYSVDEGGFVYLPVTGQVQVGGMTASEVVTLLREVLKRYLVEPDVTVSITTFHSQPITILGAVANPGTHQLEGHKSLFEVISLVGGLRPDAGYKIHITRQLAQGRIPLPDAVDEPSGKFSIASVTVKSVLDASDPNENIEIKPEDVITVPRGELIYVIGAVKKPGGFVLTDHESLTTLQLMALAEGLDRFAAPHRARLLRAVDHSATARVESPLDLKRIVDGKDHDIELRANDVLIIPSSARKAATVRSIEAVIGIGTSAATVGIYR
jgi:polysaccharide biosynthesis/export protein